ncbi:MAG: phage major capsid protein [Clostridiales bacterium]|nr:phage major capsid protein [Clostridiales bacterium]
MAYEGYDLCGWATRSNIRCSDGRMIMTDAFKDCDGAKVPLVWSHDHKNPENVLGHAYLENRGDGVYAYGYLNDTDRAQNVKKQLKHGDITALSIWADDLQQKGSNVVHGIIREVSLVLAGANPGAYIDSVALAHGADSDDEAIIYSGMNLDELFHSAADDEKKSEDADDDKNESSKSDDDETVQDVIDTMDEKQKKVLNYLVGAAAQSKKSSDSSDDDKKDNDEDDDKTAAHSGISEGGSDMKVNVFDQSTQQQPNVLSHDQMDVIFKDAKRLGSLKDSFLSHADEYGITDIDYLFPDYRTIEKQPDFISRKMDWVSKVMNGVSHTPFSRIKTIHADITADEARALGYIKGNKKKEEVFTLLKRTTDPQTVYKKQKLDRDDILDITDFDVVAWIKQEMRQMLDEELARAFLIGDGRLADSEDKIQESHIRPILTDDDLYTIKSTVTPDTDEELASALIDQAVRSRIDYRGSGSPVMYIAESYLTEMLLLKDLNQRRIYKDVNELATAMMVKEIVPVPVMENCTRTDSSSLVHDVYAIIINLNDYKVGADKGGAVNTFDDFDIDYNQQKYLMETRCSGALVKPYSAIVLESAGTAAE